MLDFDAENGELSPGGMRLKRGPRYVREKFRGKSFLIPACVTVTGIFCGFLALVSVFKGRFEYATKCIGLAIILDGLDGRVARRLNATSAFGREFDSLADVIAFGVAPAFLVYFWAFNSMFDEFGLLVSFVFVVCGATRLARFNIMASGESGQASSSFVGLPIPGAAAAIASVIYCYPEPITNVFAVSFMLGYTLFIGSLMVSTVPYLSVKRVKLTHGNQAILVVLVALTVALTWKYSELVILTLATSYAWSGFVVYLVKRYASHFRLRFGRVLH